MLTAQTRSRSFMSLGRRRCSCCSWLASADSMHLFAIQSLAAREPATPDFCRAAKFAAMIEMRASAFLEKSTASSSESLVLYCDVSIEEAYT
jgi:hypothetical protein